MRASPRACLDQVMRHALILLLAGCLNDVTALHWNLDASSCERLHADTVEWAFVQDQTVVADILLPCAEADVEDERVPLRAEPHVALRGDQSQVIQTCTPVLRRGGWWCEFAVP
jgi:hypothetical protein